MLKKVNISWQSLLVLGLSLIVLVVPTTVGFAADLASHQEIKSTITPKKIPARMEAGTVLTFDSKNNEVILEKGATLKLSPEAEKQKNLEASLSTVELPEAKPGMVVIYDALGAPVVTNPGQNELPKVDLIEIGNAKDIQSDSTRPLVTAQSSQTGYVSWYNGEGKIGYFGFTIPPYGAAHRTIAAWTWVNTTSNENGKATQVMIADRGPFVEGRILDMTATGFSILHPLSKGIFWGTITW